MNGFRCFLATALIMSGCGKSSSDDGSAGLYGSCSINHLSQTNVRSCIDFVSLTPEQLVSAKAVCEEPDSTVAKAWQERKDCDTANRLGKCTMTSDGLTTIHWTYGVGSEDGDNIARGEAEQSCLAGVGGDSPGVWSAIFN